MLAKVQMQALDNAGIDRPPSLGQDRRDGLCRAEDDAVGYTDDASTPRGRDDLGIEEPGPRHPAWLGLRAFGLLALGRHPLAVVRDERGKILPETVGQEQRGAVRRQHLRDVMNETLSHRQGALTDIHGQYELADRV